MRRPSNRALLAARANFTAAWVLRDAGVERLLRDHSTAKDKVDDTHSFSVEYTNAKESKIFMRLFGRVATLLTQQRRARREREHTAAVR